VLDDIFLIVFPTTIFKTLISQKANNYEPVQGRKYENSIYELVY